MEANVLVTDNLQDTSLLQNPYNTNPSCFYNTVPWECTIKHYRFIIYRFCSKLVCLSKIVCSWPIIYKALADYRIHTILIRNIFIIQSPGPALQKHYVSVIYRFHSKLVCLSKSMCLWQTIYKTLAYYRVCTILISNVL